MQPPPGPTNSRTNTTNAALALAQEPVLTNRIISNNNNNANDSFNTSIVDQAAATPVKYNGRRVVSQNTISSNVLSPGTVMPSGSPMQLQSPPRSPIRGNVQYDSPITETAAAAANLLLQNRSRFSFPSLNMDSNNNLFQTNTTTTTTTTTTTNTNNNNNINNNNNNNNNLAQCFTSPKRNTNTSDLFIYTSPVKMRAPPSAPRKREAKALDPVVQNALEVSNRTQQIWGTINFTVTAIRGAAGNYSQAYTVNCSRPLVTNVSNDQIIFKSYKPEIIDDKKSKVKYFFTNSISQYDMLVAKNFPVAEIFNRGSVAHDGFFLVRRIPYAFPALDPSKNPNELDPRTLNLLNQVKSMFEFAYRENLPLDLQRSNLRITDDGRVVLIDFREEDQDDSFNVLIPNLATTFGPRDSAIYNYIEPRLNVPMITK